MSLGSDLEKCRVRERYVDGCVVKSEDEEINVDSDSEDAIDMNEKMGRHDESPKERRNNDDHQRPFTNFCIENILNSNFGGKLKLHHQYMRDYQQHCDVTRYIYGRDFVTGSDIKRYRVDYRVFGEQTNDTKIDEVRYSDALKKDKLCSRSNKRNPDTKIHQYESRTALDLSRKTRDERVQNNEEDSEQEMVTSSTQGDNDRALWPAWVFCTRYSDRPSSGPRMRKPKNRKDTAEKRPRTAFSKSQLERLKVAFDQNQYLTETSRISLSDELALSQSQIKIWFQNKRAKLKKSSSSNNALADELCAQGLYNHSTVKHDVEVIVQSLDGEI